MQCPVHRHASPLFWSLLMDSHSLALATSCSSFCTADNATCEGLLSSSTFVCSPESPTTVAPTGEPSSSASNWYAQPAFYIAAPAGLVVLVLVIALALRRRKYRHTRLGEDLPLLGKERGAGTAVDGATTQDSQA